MKKYESIITELKTEKSIKEIADKLGYEDKHIYDGLKRLRSFKVIFYVERRGKAKFYTLEDYTQALSVAQYLDMIAPKIDRRKVQSKKTKEKAYFKHDTVKLWLRIT